MYYQYHRRPGSYHLWLSTGPAPGPTQNQHSGFYGHYRHHSLENVTGETVPGAVWCDRALDLEA